MRNHSLSKNKLKGELSGRLVSRRLNKKIAVHRDADRFVFKEDRWRSGGDGTLFEHGFPWATYYNWRMKYGGMEASDLKRTKEPETDNTNHKGMHADLALENRAINGTDQKKL